jgi:death-on-curing protein
MKASSRFLSVDDVILMQADTLAHEGGLAGIRDRGLLESAVMMPRQQFGGVLLHRTLAEQAAAYLFHICRNHPFNDGNKRAAVLAALVFLHANGVRALPTPALLEQLTMRCAAGDAGKDEVTAFFRKHVRAAGTVTKPTKPKRRKGEDRRG